MQLASECGEGKQGRRILGGDKSEHSYSVAPKHPGESDMSHDMQPMNTTLSVSCQTLPCLCTHVAALMAAQGALGFLLRLRAFTRPFEIKPFLSLERSVSVRLTSRVVLRHTFMNLPTHLMLCAIFAKATFLVTTW
jgi:hypothetical protein